MKRQPNQPGEERRLAIGALARVAGVSVRTLHYYEEIGLLSPARDAGGRRAYSTSDVSRLQQIRSLRELGFSLAQVATVLERPDTTLQAVLALHVARLRDTVSRQSELLERLEAVTRLAARRGAMTMDEMLTALEMFAETERYFTPEQRALLARRRAKLGDAAIVSGENAWKTLMSDVRRAMQERVSPDHQSVRALAARWSTLVSSFSGGDAGIERALTKRATDRVAKGEKSALEIREMCDYLAPAFRYIREESKSR